MHHWWHVGAINEAKCAAVPSDLPHMLLVLQAAHHSGIACTACQACPTQLDVCCDHAAHCLGNVMRILNSRTHSLVIFTAGLHHGTGAWQLDPIAAVTQARRLGLLPHLHTKMARHAADESRRVRETLLSCCGCSWVLYIACRAPHSQGSTHTQRCCSHSMAVSGHVSL